MGGGDDVGEISCADVSLGAVHRIGSDEQRHRFAVDEMTAEVWWNDEDEVGLAQFHALQRVRIGGRQTAESEMRRNFKALNQLAREGGAVVVYDADTDVAHFHTRDPRGHAHDDDREQ